MQSIVGKTAIITGASSGIGAAIAKTLATEGVNVVLAARRKDKLEAIANEINEKGKGQAKPIVTNVADQADVERMKAFAIEKFGTIDIYVNNAGQMLSSKMQDGHVSDWEQMVDVNIKGVLYGIHAVLPEMVSRKSGHIINIASVSGLEVTKTSTVYSATKFAVRTISMGLEKELAKTGVRVTNISPGMVRTDLSGNWKAFDRKPLEAIDIANAVVYAVSQPDYVNVNEITVRPT